MPYEDDGTDQKAQSSGVLVFGRGNESQLVMEPYHESEIPGSEACGSRHRLEPLKRH